MLINIVCNITHYIRLQYVKNLGVCPSVKCVRYLINLFVLMV